MSKAVLEYFGKKHIADIRRASNMENVISDKEWVSKNKTAPLYYMFRGVYRSDSDRKLFEKCGIRHDITVIPPMKMGNEFVKTYGHGHPVPKGKKHSYPELYQVLEGKAIFLVQNDSGNVKSVLVVKAKKGDCFFVPPDTEHFTINATKKDLKMANLVAEFSSFYENVDRKAGAAYYYSTNRKWIKNPNYRFHPKIKFMKPDRRFGKDIYRLIETPEKLAILSDPDKAAKMKKL